MQAGQNALNLRLARVKRLCVSALYLVRNNLLIAIRDLEYHTVMNTSALVSVTTTMVLILALFDYNRCDALPTKALRLDTLRQLERSIRYARSHVPTR